MWERSEIKRQAKSCLKQYYWQAVLMILLYSLLAAGLGVLSKMIPFAGILVKLFVSNVIGIGLLSYFRKQECGQTDAGIGSLFEFFRNDVFFNIVCVKFLLAVKQFLWTLLLIIPGIIKHYEYYMVPYLACEYPEKDHKELFSLSKEMMTGNKLKTWFFELTFVGWFLLGILTLGIGLLFVMPYYQASLMELYLKLKEEKLGITRRGTTLYGGQTFIGGQASISGQAASGGQASISGQALIGGQAYFAGVQGALAGVNYPIPTGAWVALGSDASACGIVIKGAQTSPVHMQIYFDGSQFYVADYSAAGTNVLQQGYLPKEQVVGVKPGTYFQIGNSQDVFVLMCQ